MPTKISIDQNNPQWMIQELEKIVEAACKAETNIFSYTIWTHHITRVVENAKKLAHHFGADLEVVEIAALLHDYASIKDENLYRDHHVHGPVEAEKLLRQFDYPQEKIEQVKHAIASHRGSVSIERLSPEAECLANADALAHIDNLPSLLHLAYIQLGKDIDEGAEWVLKKLERTWSKLHPSIQELAKEQYDAARKVLLKQLENKQQISKI